MTFEYIRVRFVSDREELGIRVYIVLITFLHSMWYISCRNRVDKQKQELITITKEREEEREQYKLNVYKKE